MLILLPVLHVQYSILHLLKNIPIVFTLLVGFVNWFHKVLLVTIASHNLSEIFFSTLLETLKTMDLSALIPLPSPNTEAFVKHISDYLGAK